MNQRYRKVMRLRSRHHRRGHTPWCSCPEMLQAMYLAINRRLRRDPLHVTRVSPTAWAFIHDENPDYAHEDEDEDE